MRILRLTAENIKRLSVVDIEPSGAVVQITGKNGQGKTSVLDAIWWALGGGANVQKKPIRKGAESGRIELTLGDKDNPRFIVERRFTENNTYLKVKTPDGASYESPQKLLDKFLDFLSFDPLKFMRSDTKEQFDVLRRLVKVDLDFDQVAKERAELFALRTAQNKETKAAEARALAIKVDPAAPDSPIDMQALIDEMRNVSEWNSAVAKLRGAAATAKTLCEAAETEVGRIKAQLATAQRKATEARDALAAAERSANDPVNVEKDIDDLREKIRLAETANAAYQNNLMRRTIEKEAEASRKEADKLTKRIEQIDAKKDAAISEAEMPVDGLEFGDGEVFYNGLPLDQASDAQQLMVSTAIAAALNPELRVLRIRDGSLLDEDRMKELAAFAESRDFQIWIERVDSSGEVGIVMEDGHVKGAQLVAAE